MFQENLLIKLKSWWITFYFVMVKYVFHLLFPDLTNNFLETKRKVSKVKSIPPATTISTEVTWTGSDRTSSQMPEKTMRRIFKKKTQTPISQKLQTISEFSLTLPPHDKRTYNVAKRQRELEIKYNTQNETIQMSTF